jgi:hypothetical protein
MHRQHSSKIRFSLLSAALLVGLITAPARADHADNAADHADNAIVPIAAGVVLGAMLYHGHGHHSHYSKRYGHYSGYRQHGYGHQGYRQHRGNRHGNGQRSSGSRSHSSSYGGYSRRSGRDDYRHQSRRKH